MRNLKRISIYRRAPQRVVTAITRERCGRGHVMIWHLECGHTATHLYRPKGGIGSRTACEQCV